MKKILKLTLIGACLAALVGVLAACGSPAQGGREGVVPADDEATVQFDGGELLYSQGDMIVMLDGNATTGYEWTSEITGSTVTQDMDEYVEEGGAMDEAGKDAVAGAGGVHMFGYKANGSGDASITLKYARSWEESPDDKTVVIEVTVQDGMFTKVAAK
ncbi:protease inhibitor I42 family protein [Arabiibacter massiliensis]|uniref:protease inhibitor I42 family protein n=1 Tax=Arabiibacter massiliensis TaxID=1870985 RepID=UPI0009BAE667|nr:protease inhibitor I42 family protein [Arabiibacter massiliensis]